MDKIDTASNHLLGIINDVLDMSKIEAGKFELSCTEFNLEKMIGKITSVIGFRMEEKGLHFCIRIDPDVPQTIISDEQRLHQVIANLLSNAVKFTPDMGKISLHIQNLKEENGFYSLQFAVEDTGIGVSKEQKERLFQSFEQADGSVSRKYGGTGLGLAISKTIVEMMDGEIWVESEPGEGSSFIFTIRAQKGEGHPETLLDDGADASSFRILVVDNETDAFDCIVAVLSPVGIRCEMAANEREACTLFDEQDPFHIIFIDEYISETHGTELRRMVKERFDKTAIVIMVPEVDWSQRKEEPRESDAVHLIGKPLHKPALLACINEYLTWQNSEIRDNPALDVSVENIFEGKRILLAEDVDINREILLALLEPTGLQIDCAENGLLAFEKFKAHPESYDMIFMDIHMPEVSGYESTQMIRALSDPHAQTIPIVAMTANVFREDIEKCLASGMNAHIGKPLNIDSVMLLLRQHLLSEI